MKRNTAIRVELIGAILVLVSVGWELFIERPTIDLQQDATSFRIEDKLDQMWIQIGAIRDKIDPTPGFTSSTESPFEASKRWHMSGDRSELKLVSTQARVSTAIRGLLFAVGSIMLIVARRHELLHKSTAG